MGSCWTCTFLRSSPWTCWAGLCQSGASAFGSSIFHVVTNSAADPQEQMARALLKGAAQLGLLVDSSQLTEASLGTCLVVLGWRHSVVPGCQSPQGLTQAGMKVLLSLPYRQNFSIGEHHCGSTGTSLRATPQLCTQPFLAGKPSPFWDSDAARPPATSCKLMWPEGKPEALMASDRGSMARPSVELAASQQTPAYGGCSRSQHH